MSTHTTPGDSPPREVSEELRDEWWPADPATWERRAASARRRGRHGFLRGARRRRRNRRVVRIGLLSAAILSLGVLAAAADAYYQSFKIYRDVRVVLPNLRQAGDHLARGQLPPGDPFGRADLAARRAGQAVDRARFTFKLTGALPFLGRPVDAVSHGVAAARNVTQAALITQGAVTDLLGEAATNPGSVGAADTPVYEGGAVNVDLLAGMTPRLERVVAHLRAARREIRAIPAVPFIPGVDEATDEAMAESDRAIRLAERMRTGIGVLPAFLGARERMTYLIALQNQADMKGTGGGLLAYGLVAVEGGRFQLLAGGSVNDIRVDPARLPPGVALRRIDVPMPPGVSWYVDNVPRSYPWMGTANFSPDFPPAALTWARMVKEAMGIDIDGVIAMDQIAVARMLGSRTIRVPAYPRPITGRNLGKVVGHDQYFLPSEQQAQFPAQLILAAWPKLLDPSPLQASLRSFGQSLTQKHVQLWSARPDLQAQLRALGWDGGVHVNPGDYLYVARNKLVVNKLDYSYSRVSIDYKVTIDRSGDGAATLDVTLTNNAPSRGLPRLIAGRVGQGVGYAVNRALMLAFVPERARLVQAVPEAGFPDHTEAGAKVFARTIRVRPGESQTMRLRYAVDDLVASVEGGRLYRLTIQHQPLPVPVHLTVTVTLPEGAAVQAAPPGWTGRGNVLRLETELTHDMVHEIVF